jgi:sugar-specific transcriptional regulator TrmB
MDSKLIKQIENNLGFSEKKAKIFLALLQLGETNVLAIAQKAKLKRTTVYNILPELIEEGLVAATSTKKSKRYFVTDPRIILKILENKVEDTKSLLPMLTALHAVSIHQPKISLYEGENGAKQIYEDVIKSTYPGDIICGFSGDIKTNYVSDKDLNNYIKARMGKKIRNRIIVSSSEYANLLRRNAQEELREVKVFTEIENLKAPSVDLKIYRNKVAIVSYRENFLGIVIESRDINQMCEIIFNSLWSKL